MILKMLEVEDLFYDNSYFDTATNHIEDKRHNAKNEIIDDTHNVTNVIISDKRHDATNVIIGELATNVIM